MRKRKRRRRPITSCAFVGDAVVERSARIASDNPCRHVRKLKGGEGYEPWSWEHIIHFREHVSQARSFGGRRRWRSTPGSGKATYLRMLWSDVSEGFIVCRAAKDGQEALDSDAPGFARGVGRKFPSRAITILTNSRGQPWTADGFKTSWGKELDRE